MDSKDMESPEMKNTGTNLNGLFLANGMQRSGSTWLYNAIRHIISKLIPEDDFTCGWCQDVTEFNKVTLIKVHGIDHPYLQKAGEVFYSYRDVRDVLASMKRKWKIEPTIGVAENLISECEFFERRAGFVMRYESFVDDPKAVVQALVEYLNVVDVIDVSQVMSSLESDRSPCSTDDTYDPKNLYHLEHITNGRSMSFAGKLAPSLLNEIEIKHETWFVDHGYHLVSRKQSYGHSAKK